MYVGFVGQAGEPSLKSVNQEFPMFGLAAVLLLEREYTARVDRQVKQFKRATMGSADIRLNAREIAKQSGPYRFLTSREKRRHFSQALTDLLAGLPIIVVAACLNKEMHRREYGAFDRGAYAFTLPFLMERMVYLLASRHDSASVTVQARGGREDRLFEMAWDQQCAEGSYYHSPTEFSSRLTRLEFRKARENLSGLQIAGLAANACARFVLDPQKPHDAFAAFSPKLYQGTFTEPDRFGLKVIP